MTAFDKQEAERLVALTPPAHRAGGSLGITLAGELADQLQAALTEIDRLITLNGAWAEAASANLKHADELQEKLNRATSVAKPIKCRSCHGTGRRFHADALVYQCEPCRGSGKATAVDMEREIDRLTRRAQVAELELEAMRPIVDAETIETYFDAIDHYRSTADERATAIAKLAGDAPT